MQNTPKSLRLQIALFGRTNAGKSTFLNLLSGQEVAITSPVPGTTTDVVEKAMELLPIGPVLFLDTAGLDDSSELGGKRISRSLQVFQRADVAVLICSGAFFGAPEEEVLRLAKEKNIPVIAVVNKCDLHPASPEFVEKLKQSGADRIITATATNRFQRERVLAEFKQAVLALSPEDFLNAPPLLGDLVRPGETVVLVVPIDIQAPKGRLILPQVQTLRDGLDHNAKMLVVKEDGYPELLQELKHPPALVVCDSQVVHVMMRETPPGIPCTTFSILLSRLKGNMELMAQGAAAIDRLRPGDRVLIAEACTHHATDDDIGRVKIPRLLQKHLGFDLDVQVCAGRDYPADLRACKLVIHCGGCMFNRREILSRIQLAQQAGVPVTNYGMSISHAQGVLERTLSPFPSALKAYLNVKKR